MALLWFANSAIYYGIVLFTPVYFDELSQLQIDSNTEVDNTSSGEAFEEDYEMYMDVFISTAAELPGLALAALITNVIGRKKTMAIMMFMCGASALLLLAVSDSEWLSLALMCVSRAGIMGAYAVLYAYTPEVFPTTVRMTGLGFASAFSRVGAIITPFIVTLLSDVWLPGPIVIFGSLALIAAGIALLLPVEPAGKELSDTILKDDGVAVADGDNYQPSSIITDHPPTNKV